MLLDVALTTIDVSPALLVDAARAAEDAGFDGVWLYDHLSGVSFAGTSTLDVWSGLTAVALATHRVTVGPLVLNAAARHPAHVAVATATVQAYSGGRLHLGLGAGAGPGDPFSAELAMLGLPVLGAAERRELVADTIGYLRALWSGSPAYQGRQHRLSAPEGVPVPDPVPPIVVGANGPRMAALAGALADGVNVHDWQDGLADLVAVAREQARARAATHFQVSVEASFEPSCLDPDGAARQRMAELDVERLMFRWPPSSGTAAIAEAGRRMRG